MSTLPPLPHNPVGRAIGSDNLVLPDVAPSGQVTFNPESLNNILAGRPNAPIEVGNQQAKLSRITPGSSGMAVPLSRDGGYVLNLGSRDVYLDSAGKCVEVRDPSTGKRLHPRNIVVQSFVESLASSGIRAGLGGNAEIHPVSFEPKMRSTLPGSGPSTISMLPPSSDVARYLNPFGRQLIPEELEMLEKTGYAAPLDEVRQARGLARKTNSFLGVRGACDDFAFNDAERRGVNRFAFARIDEGFRGKPIETLEELLRTARPGTIIHTSYTGFSGENADGRHQGSHWGVYVGGGVVIDQYGFYTIPEFVKEYNSGRGRKIEALFTHPRM